ncbi:MAG TPA: hypothetical protein VMR52_08635 [Dehalococcoidia bacterium]|nr:hypothetical protein [Dehalococcoidia bacterium]
MALIWLAIARAAIVIVALALILLPGEVWSDAETDYEQTAFDTDLVYTGQMSRSTFDPYLVYQHGTWESCPCRPGSAVTIAGSGLSGSRAESEGGAFLLNDTQVFVNGGPAILHLVTPTQIDLALPAVVAGPVATIEVLRDGETIGSDTVAIGNGPLATGTSVTEGELRLNANLGAEPEIHLITTPLSFQAGMTATIEEQASGAAPLWLKLWNPRNTTSLEIVFDQDGQVYATFMEGPGRIARQVPMLAYETGTAYDIAFDWERGERGAVSISGQGETYTFETTSAEAPALFDAYRPTLTVGASAHEGSSAATLTNYHLELPTMRFTTLRVHEPLVAPLVGLLAVLGALLLLASVTPARAARGASAAITGWARSLRRQLREHPAGSVAVASVLIFYVALNGVLFTLGSHPFDMGSQTAWSYIAAEYGVTDLYYVSQTTTLADVWNGVPYHEAVFPYNAGMSYYFWFIGEAHLFLFGHASPDSASMQVTIKAFNLAFLLADTALIYAIVRHLKPESTRLPWVVSAIVLFNPAVIFDTAVWGETESVVLFPLLASLLAALKDRPGIAWPFLALAFLSKQTVLLPVIAIAVVYLFRFDFRRNMEGFAGAMVGVLAVILPFTLNGYPPSIAIDPTLAAIWVHGGAGAERAYQVVSYDSFNIWTLVTFVADGASGLGRFQASDYTARLGSLSYRELGLIALAASLAALLLVTLARRRSSQGTEHAVFAVISLVFALELFLPTQTLSRYYVFAIVFAALGLAGPSRWLSGTAVVAFTITSFVGQYGSLALVLQDFPQHAEHLAPQNNIFSRGMADLFTLNGFITVAVLLNSFAVLALAAAFWRGAVNVTSASIELIPADTRQPIRAPVAALFTPGEM